MIVAVGGVRCRTEGGVKDDCWGVRRQVSM